MSRSNSGSQHDISSRRSAPGDRRERAAESTAPVEQAIQTGCGTLLALQASLASVEDVPGEHSRAEASLRAAIELVTAAISDLRESISSGERSPLSLGFVAAPGARDQ
jgi:hypothetical protein